MNYGGCRWSFSDWAISSSCSFQPSSCFRATCTLQGATQFCWGSRTDPIHDLSLALRIEFCGFYLKSSLWFNCYIFQISFLPLSQIWVPFWISSLRALILALFHYWCWLDLRTEMLAALTITRCCWYQLQNPFPWLFPYPDMPHKTHLGYLLYSTWLQTTVSWSVVRCHEQRLVLYSILMKCLHSCLLGSSLEPWHPHAHLSTFECLQLRDHSYNLSEQNPPWWGLFSSLGPSQLSHSLQTW